MIKSLDRISYLTNSLEEAEKTFSAFFDAKSSKKVFSKNRNYESVLYGFENMNFEIIKKNDGLSEEDKLCGFSLLSDDLTSLNISTSYEEYENNEESDNKTQLIKSIDIKQSPDFQLSVNEYEELDMNRSNDNNLFALDHLVLTTNKSDVLINLYEKELGINPVIASVSLGAERKFKFRHKKYKENQLKHEIILQNGSLLLMSGPTQHHWLHEIPRTAKLIGPRINLTFRLIQTTDQS